MKILNLQVIDFTKDIFPIVENKILNALYDQNITPKVKSKEFKKLFFHYTILEWITWINNNPKSFFIITKPSVSQINKIYTIEEWNIFYELNIRKIISSIPLYSTLLFYNSSFYTDEKGLQDENIEKVKTLIFNLNKKENTFKKIKSFTKTYDLIFLNKTVFQQLKTKFYF